MKQRAFTLIEMLLASVLATTLMVGVLSILPRLQPAEAARYSGDDRSSRKPTFDGMEECIALLRDDLRHADEFDFAQDGQVTLVGYCGLDRVSRQRTHRPVRVTYLVATVNGRDWLVRRQSALDVLSNDHVQWDLVLSGVTRFELAPAEGEAATSSKPKPIPTWSAQESKNRSAAGGKSPESSAEAAGTAAPRHLDPEEVIMVDSLPVYRKFAPPWALAIHDAKKYGLPMPASPAPKAQPTQSAPATPLAPSAPPAVLIWRLRTWAGDGEPALDRMLCVRRMPTP